MPNQPIFKTKSHFEDLLLAQVEVLQYQIEANHLSRVIMSWNSKTCLLPQNTQEYKQTIKSFKSDILLALMTEKDSLNE